MSTSPFRPYRFRRGKRGFTFYRTLQAEALEARLLLSGSSLPRPSDLTAAVLSSAPVEHKLVLTKIVVSPNKASVDCYATQQFTAVGLRPIWRSSGEAAQVHLEGQFGHDYVRGSVYPFHRPGSDNDHGGQRLDSRQGQGDRFQ